MKKALAGQSYMPCRSAVDNLTHPKEFHFATDDRLGPSTHHTQTEQKEKDFVGTLRQHPPSPVSRVKSKNWKERRAAHLSLHIDIAPLRGFTSVNGKAHVLRISLSRILDSKNWRISILRKRNYIIHSSLVSTFITWDQAHVCARYGQILAVMLIGCKNNATRSDWLSETAQVESAYSLRGCFHEWSVVGGEKDWFSCLFYCFMVLW